MKNLWKVLVGLFSFFGGIASLALFLVSLMDVSFGVGEDSGSKVMPVILLFVFGPLAYYCFKTFFSMRKNAIAQSGETLIEQPNNKEDTDELHKEIMRRVLERDQELIKEDELRSFANNTAEALAETTSLPKAEIERIVENVLEEWKEKVHPTKIQTD
jgi:hypothetical protein